MIQQDRTQKLIDDGFRPVKLALLYSANIIIQPKQTEGNVAGWVEYPEYHRQIMIDGGALADLAEIFNLKTYPLQLKKRRSQSLKYMDINLLTLTMQEADQDYPVQVLYAKEEQCTLKLVTIHHDGWQQESSYRGDYTIHWQTEEEHC